MDNTNNDNKLRLRVTGENDDLAHAEPDNPAKDVYNNDKDKGNEGVYGKTPSGQGIYHLSIY